MEGVRQRKKEKDPKDAVEEEKFRSRNADSGLPSVYSVAFLLGFLVLLKSTIVLNQRLPQALTVADEAKYPERYCTFVLF